MTTMDKLNGKLIDLHAHILPGLDDGASDRVEALAMARQAVEHQIQVVAATPHFIDLTWDHVKNEAAKLGELLAAHHVDLTVVPGAELFIDLDLTGLAKEEIPTYNDAGKYCLIEFPMMELPPMLIKCSLPFKSKVLLRLLPILNVIAMLSMIPIWQPVGLRQDV